MARRTVLPSLGTWVVPFVRARGGGNLAGSDIAAQEFLGALVKHGSMPVLEVLVSQLRAGSYQPPRARKGGPKVNLRVVDGVFSDHGLAVLGGHVSPFSAMRDAPPRRLEPTPDPGWPPGNDLPVSLGRGRFRAWCATRPPPPPPRGARDRAASSRSNQIRVEVLQKLVLGARRGRLEAPPESLGRTQRSQCQ